LRITHIQGFDGILHGLKYRLILATQKNTET